MLKKMLYATCQQKVLYFLLAHPEQKYYDREISRLVRTGRASTNYALRGLVDTRLVKREKKGRMYFYYVAVDDPIIRYLKVTQNLIYIKPLADKLKDASLKIVLYGSFAAGTNHAESDIDLFVLSREPKSVKGIIYKSQFREKLQYVIASPQDFIRLKKENLVFHRQISGGIILHEAKQ